MARRLRLRWFASLHPGVTVIQTDDPASLAVLGAVDGPGIAALMPEGAAKFMHVPGKGKALNERLAVGLPSGEGAEASLGFDFGLPADGGTQTIGVADRQCGSRRAPVRRRWVQAVPEMDEAGQLASWLIHQANFSGVLRQQEIRTEWTFH